MKQGIKTTIYYQSYTVYPRNESFNSSQAIDWGLRTPRTHHHLQYISHQLSLLSSSKQG